MSSIIDDEIFKLVTKPENFDFAWDVAERFSEIKSKLWFDFFEKLKTAVAQQYKSYILQDDAKWRFTLAQKKWNNTKFFFSIIGDYLEIGVIITLPPKKKIDDLFDEWLTETFTEFRDESNKNRFFYYSSSEENLTTLQGIKNILPSNVDNIIAEYIVQFQTIHDIVISKIDDFERV